MKAESTRLYGELLKVMGAEAAKVELQKVIDSTDFSDDNIPDGAFIWTDTPQGHHYWSRIADKINNKH